MREEKGEARQRGRSSETNEGTRVEEEEERGTVTEDEGGCSHCRGSIATECVYLCQVYCSFLVLFSTHLAATNKPSSIMIFAREVTSIEICRERWVLLGQRIFLNWQQFYPLVNLLNETTHKSSAPLKAKPHDPKM